MATILPLPFLKTCWEYRLYWAFCIVFVIFLGSGYTVPAMFFKFNWLWGVKENSVRYIFIFRKRGCYFFCYFNGKIIINRFSISNFLFKKTTFWFCANFNSGVRTFVTIFILFVVFFFFLPFCTRFW